MIAAVIIQGWKMLDLDLFFSPIFSKLFYWLMAFEFSISSFILDLFLPVAVNKASFLITFPDNSSVYLYEGCSGLKQVIQFSLIMLIYPGSVRRKLWFIPFSILALILAAIIHFIFLCMILYKAHDQYEFMHEYLSRWFFFGVFFLLWVLFIHMKNTVKTPSSEPDIHPG
jgi:exosortase/archaeosortase family protein